MPFVTAGYPTLDASLETILAMVAGGADLIEIGTPFSDPLADGATVQRTSQVSLANGTTLRDCIELARRARERGVEVPLVLMGYYNPIARYEIAQYVSDSAAAGVDGFIVPDLPLEESAPLAQAARAADLDYIYLVAPTTTPERLKRVGELGSGFVYCVSVTGVTGARTELQRHLGEYIAQVRRLTDLPLAVGFGLSTPEHIRQVGEIADGAIVASAMINYVDGFPLHEQPAATERFLRYLQGEATLEV